MELRKILTFVEEVFRARRDTPPTRHCAKSPSLPSGKSICRPLRRRPFAAHGCQSRIGRRISALGVAALAPWPAQSYGKAGLVGVGGEQEHAVAMLTTVFGNAMRDAVGGGKAWISSMTKRVAPGSTIDIPLAHKDALYVRSHYDGITVTLNDAPLPNEIAIIAAFANRGRLNHRVGGLAAADIKGADGLV